MTAQPGPQGAYRRAISRRGEAVTFRRVTGQAPNAQTFDAAVSAIVMNYQPAGDVMAIAPEGGITLGDRMIIVLAADLAAVNFPLPLRKNDKALVQGEWLNIENLDPSKRGIAGAIEIHAKGAR